MDKKTYKNISKGIFEKFFFCFQAELKSYKIYFHQNSTFFKVCVYWNKCIF